MTCKKTRGDTNGDRLAAAGMGRLARRALQRRLVGLVIWVRFSAALALQATGDADSALRGGCNRIDRCGFEHLGQDLDDLLVGLFVLDRDAQRMTSKGLTHVGRVTQEQILLAALSNHRGAAFDCASLQATGRKIEPLDFSAENPCANS